MYSLQESAEFCQRSRDFNAIAWGFEGLIISKGASARRMRNNNNEMAKPRNEERSPLRTSMMQTIEAVDSQEEIVFFTSSSSEEMGESGTAVGVSSSLLSPDHPVSTVSLNRQQDRPDPEGLVAADVLVLKPSTSTGSATDFDGFEEDLVWAQFNAFEQRRKSMASKRMRAFVLCLSFVVLIVAALTIMGAEDKNSSEFVAYDSPKFSWIRHSQRYESIKAFLVEAAISKDADFHTYDSPQFLAAQWLANGDGMKLAIPTERAGTHGTTFVERYAMAVFYFSLGGPEWKRQAKFLSDTHITTWQEQVDPPTDSHGQASFNIGVRGCKSDVDNTLYPCALSLRELDASNNLVGTIPDEVEFLSGIEIVHLPYNSDVTGPLPDGLGKLRRLSQISLQWCGFHGSLPSWLFNAKDLEHLMLGNNYLTGSIPTEIGTLGRLRILGLDDNNLEARLDQFGPLENVTNLYLEGNLISGPLTSDLMSGWDSIVELDLGENLLGGMLPEHFFLHPNDDLKILDLHGNQFQGSLPNAIREDRFQKLEFLALSENKFTGVFPQNIGRLQRLVHLDLSMNYFTWVIPTELGQLTSLEYLFTGGNRFATGTLPNFFQYLTNLRELSMRSNNLSGSIPHVLAQLTNLEVLDLRKSMFRILACEWEKPHD
eukprot:scaffold1525_cov142-Cylindrotheca_fusiformis.AAC.114